MVGDAGFEPATPWTQTKCATKLRQSPTIKTQGKDGVDDGVRTHDNRNHNPGLYQLSYNHHGIYIFSNGAPGRIRTFDQRLRRALLYPAELRAHRKLQKFACKQPLLKEEVVGDAGFEPATPWTQTKCATKLR